MDREFSQHIRYDFFGLPQVGPGIVHHYNKSICILDVRKPAHFDAAHIPNAVSAWWLNGEGALQRLERLDRSTPLIIVGTNTADVEIPVRMLQDRDFRCVAALRGGMEAYVRHGLPLVQRETRA